MKTKGVHVSAALVFHFILVLSVQASPRSEFGAARPITITYRAHGLNFSPYIDPDEDPRSGGSQITPGELRERLIRIAPYTHWIKTFGCNDDLREAGMLADSLGLQAAVGAWLGTDTLENASQINCLVEVAKAGYVDIAVVGSEVLLRADLSEAQLIGYINTVKDSFAASGLSIPVAYSDVYGMLLEHPNVIAAVDIVLVNYYPFWEGREIGCAVAYLHRAHQQMLAAAGNKKVIVSETGWPSCGEPKLGAVPSPENASFYFLNFVSWARANNVDYFYFEAYDEPWKASSGEGSLGACWGIWDNQGNMKSGMHAVFDGDSVPDNWSDPQCTEVVRFRSLSDLIETNIPTFLVADYTDTSNTVLLNGDSLPSGSMDDQGNFVVTVPLADGDNILSLVVRSGPDTLVETHKTVRYDSTFSTGGKRLLYVDAVPGEWGPSISGTVVIDLNSASILGIIEGEHIVGISPDLSEIYMSDRSVYDTATHRKTRTLAFSADIPPNGFLVSPDGTRLYSRNERLDVQTNTLLASLPVDITTGSSWGQAPVPGGPAISRDGRYIYCGNNIYKVDTVEDTLASTGMSGHFMSDIALPPNGRFIVVSEYSWSNGRAKVYDGASYEPLVTISYLGDFSGEIAFSRDQRIAVVGSSGNPAFGQGRLTVINLSDGAVLSQLGLSLADNIAAALDKNYSEFYVSTGESGPLGGMGVSAYVLDVASGYLALTKTFFLGINRFYQSTGRPKNDQIRKIVYKPKEPVGVGTQRPPGAIEIGLEVYPNPFNPTAMVEYVTPGDGRVSVRIFDIAGRLVCTLVDKYQEAGRHVVEWRGRDRKGRPVASGVYFVKVEEGGQRATRKIVLIR